MSKHVNQLKTRKYALKARSHVLKQRILHDILKKADVVGPSVFTFVNQDTNYNSLDLYHLYSVSNI